MTDQADIAIGKPALELGAGEPVCSQRRANDQSATASWNTDFAKIDGNGSSIHVGLLSF